MKQTRLLTSVFALAMSLSMSARTIATSEFAGYDYDNDANLWKSIDQKTDYTTSYYYAPGWGQIADPVMTQDGSLYTYSLPAATSDQWQAQCFLIPTNLTLSSATKYDFSCQLTSTTDISHVTVKLTSKSDDSYFLFTEVIQLKANEPTTLYLSELVGVDADCKLVFDFGGNGANCIANVNRITLKDNAVDDGTMLPATIVNPTVHGYTYNHSGNLWKPVDDNKDYKTRFWYAPGWNQIADPEYTQTGSTWTFTLPAATTDQWQAQCFITPTMLKLNSETQYDFSCIITSTTDISHVTVKLTDKTSDANFLFTEVVEVKANEAKVVKLSDLKGIDADCELVLDFGGNGENCVVNVQEITLKDHAVNDGSDFNGFNYEHEANLWRPIDEANDHNATYYYAPGWSQIADPVLTKEGSKYSWTLPAATTDQWQAQIFLNPTSMKLNSDTQYDFSCIITSTTDISHVTVKLTDKTSDGYFLFTETFPMSAGEEKIFYLTNLTGIDADCKLVLDFGGNGENCVITVDRITLKDHAVNDGTVVPGQDQQGEDEANLETAYNLYQTRCEEIKKELETASYDCDERDVLYAYLTDEDGPSETYPNGTSLFILINKPLDLEGIKAETEFLNNLYLKMITASLTEGSDVTQFLTNADMSQAGFKGWDMTIIKRGGSYNANSGTGMSFWPCAESWNTAFDCNQTVDNMPNGLYEIGVYAYYRPGPMDSYLPDATIPCELYMNDFYTPVMNITDDGLAEEEAEDQVNCRLTAPDGIETWSVDFLSPFGYIPNGEFASSYAFRAGRYYQKVYGMVTDGVMKLGIRNTGDPWYENGVAFWSQFKVIYMGKNAEALDAVLASYEQRAEALISGQQYHYAGYNAELIVAIEAGKAATEVDEKYNCVIRINDAFNVLSNSVAIYSDLAATNETFLSWLYDENNGLTDEQKKEYTELYNNVWNNIAVGTYTDEEAAAMAEKLKNLQQSGTSIAVVNESAQIVNVYTMNGQLVTRGGLKEAQLKPGLYIIQSNGKSLKKIIK